MTSLRWNSVRVRLTVLNVSVLALVLVGFSAVLYFGVEVQLQRGARRDLAERARSIVDPAIRFGNLPPPWGPTPRPEPNDFGRPGVPAIPPSAFPRFQPPPPGQAGGPRGPFGGPPPGRPRDLRNAPTAPDGESDPAQDFFRRARVLAPDGTPYGPLRQDRAFDEAAFQASLRGESRYSNVHLIGEPTLVYSTPIRGRDRLIGVVQVAYPLGEQRRFQSGLFGALLMLIPLAVLATGAAGAFMTHRALSPVRQVTTAAAHIGVEDLSRRLRVESDDEFGELAQTFNGMIARLDDAFQRLETAYEQQRRFTGDASHELRTPLTTIKANTSLALQGERSPEEYREALRAADRAADTMNRIVQDLLLLTRSDAGTLSLDLQWIPIEAPISSALEMVRHHRGAEISLNLAPEPLTVRGDMHHLTRLFTNLLENALRHTPSTGRIEIAARSSGNQVIVRVLDSGEGIPPEHLPHVFDRFYRVDKARARSVQGLGGTGLGLAICRSIVQAHGGELTLQSQVGRGTALFVSLPLVSEADAARVEQFRELAGV